MNADSSWGEVRWREPQSGPPAHDPIMATRTLLAGNRPFTMDGHEERRARLMEPYRRIDHGFHVPQANLHIRDPTNNSGNTRLLSEPRYLSDYTPNTLYGQQTSAITSPLGSVDEARTGSISDHIDQSRRTSELQPTSDARTSNGGSITSFSQTTNIPSACLCVVRPRWS